MPSRPDTPPRRRDAQASRRALIDAGAALFHERGYDGTTTRDIGGLAGVDPALIARYFGHKAGLYLAVLADEGEQPGFQLPDPDPRLVAHRLLTRWDEPGRSPVARALGNPDPPTEVRALLREVLEARIVGPLGTQLADEDVDLPRLRAELLVAIMVGISLSRGNGALPEIASASHEQILELLDPMLDALAGRG